jgi:pimeloyl-ACP methyl ester carboxylesterase
MSRLIVYVPGLGESPDAIDGLYEKLPPKPITETHLYKYRERVRLFSRGELAGRCRQLARRIAAACDAYEDVDDVILIGHSIGGLMVRYTYLDAMANRSQQDEFVWAVRVSRIVLLAAPNRGFDLKRLRWWKKLGAYPLAALPVGFTCKDALMGSAFISDLRIRWIREMYDLGDTGPTVVQVLGDADQSVNYEDSRDVQGLPKGAQMALPCATHDDIVQVNTPEDDPERRRDTPQVPEDIPGQRLEILTKAIIEEVETAQSNPTPLSQSEERVQETVFALHGIRSGNADWPHRLSTLLAHDEAMHVVTPSYGRMSALSFAQPWARRRHLRWFADQYTFYLARKPGMKFHFVGHSNGTYIFGRSMTRISGLKFGQVFLAGSVLPQDFPWQVQAENRIDELLNVCATKDKPVAWLCSVLRGFRQRDVGVGGFEGFQLFTDGPQIRWIEGGHGAAFAGGVPPKTKCTKCGQHVPESSGELSTVVKFLRGDDVSERYHAVQPSPWFAWMSRMAPYIAGAGLVGLVALGFAAVILCGVQLGLGLIAAVLVVVAVILKTV